MQKVLFRIQGTTYMINPEQVVFLRAEGSYCEVKLSDGESIRLSKNLKYVERQFLDVSFLYRVHRSFVVNIHHVQKVLRPKERNSFLLELSTSDVIKMSVKNEQGLLNAIKDYL